MENISKVLRQLPEEPRRWFLKEFCKDGIPMEIESVLINQNFIMPHADIHLKISGEFLMYGTEIVKVGVYNLKHKRPHCRATKCQDPTPEQVKAIYEGVEEVECAMIDGDIGLVYLNEIHQGACMGWFSSPDSRDIYEMCLFTEGKGFALPISWKEEGKDLISPEAFLTLKGHDVDAIVHPHDRSLTIGKMNLFELMKEYFNYLTNSNDTNVATLEETPEQKGKRIEEDNTTQIFNRLKALEEEVKSLKDETQHASKEVESGNLVTKLVDFYMWMERNGYSHNIRSRVEKKASIFLETTPSPTKER